MSTPMDGGEEIQQYFGFSSSSKRTTKCIDCCPPPHANQVTVILVLTRFEPQSRFGDKALKSQVICSQSGTTVPRALNSGPLYSDSRIKSSSTVSTYCCVMIVPSSSCPRVHDILILLFLVVCSITFVFFFDLDSTINSSIITMYISPFLRAIFFNININILSVHHMCMCSCYGT